MTRVFRYFFLVAAQIVAILSPATAQNIQGLVRVSTGQTDGAPWYRIKIRPAEYSVELVEVWGFLEQNRNIVSKSYVDENGYTTSANYSLAEVWDVLEDDDSVVAVISAGYLESASSPQIAGYLELSNTELNPIMNAPNLNAMYCLNNSVFRNSADAPIISSPFQKPYLFAVNYEANRPYQYIRSENTVINEFPFDTRFFDFYHEGCSNMLQIGPRIINPRKLRDNNLDELKQNRFSSAVLSEEKGAERSRSVIAFDLRGQLSFIIFPEPTRLDSIADLLSSDQFYTAPEECSDPEDNRSISCEYWAAALTSFEHTGMVIRRETTAATFIGRSNVTIPAALVIRRITPSEN